MSKTTKTTGMNWELRSDIPAHLQGPSNNGQELLPMLSSQHSNLPLDTIRGSLRNVQRRAWLAYAGAYDLEFNISICWHAPKRLLRAELGELVDAESVGWSAHWLQRKLKHYLNKLDRKVLKSAHRNKHVKLWRLVTLEHADGVGWHAHALMATPKGHDRTEIINWITWMWIAELGQEYRDAFVPYLVQASPTHGNYIGYITKTLGQHDDDRVGTIDLVNTALPIAH